MNKREQTRIFRLVNAGYWDVRSVVSEMNGLWRPLPDHFLRSLEPTWQLDDLRPLQQRLITSCQKLAEVLNGAREAGFTSNFAGFTVPDVCGPGRGDKQLVARGGTTCPLGRTNPPTAARRASRRWTSPRRPPGWCAPKTSTWTGR
ncbi:MULTISPECIES: hypothetical protein [Actinosynnema]|uniref:hypothetical protein n=1 Tax=Actinosynnema TaxID=40566 RepID=UPI0020A3609F|nr:hypothetical protein [Actinosynnema pretiosum]MCP2097343.1 hypothetical protein [Actinosynnema pretiosum]